MLQFLFSLSILANAFASSSISDLSSLVAGEDKLCNPNGFMYRYTGLRLYHTVIHGWPARHFWYLVRCNSGKVASEQYFATNRTSNFPFGCPISISREETYVLARRRKYAQRKVPVFRPLAKIGAVYKVDRASNLTIVLLPLWADKMSSSFTFKSRFGKRMRYLPILYTPEEEPARDWDTHLVINVYENYTYTEDEKCSTWWIANEVVNAANDVLSLGTKKLTFWEFDGLQSQLEGVDWRKPVNLMLPDI